MNLIAWLAAFGFAGMFAMACFAYSWARETAKWGVLAVLLLMGAGYWL